MKLNNFLLLLSLMFLAGCGTINGSDEEILSGTVVETFTYGNMNLTIEGDFSKIGIQSNLLVLIVTEADIFDQSGKIINLESVSVGDTIEAVLPDDSIILTEDPPLIAVEKLTIID
ncbi:MULTISPECIES: hypothetical protein [Bacillaceae]|uniref:DUF3221 domain-containing protein n=1 Tax=Evansella alkalicola TaxID=745819 RepID=A0ABS6JRY4_9BACI|nr:MULTISPECIES: hypothetical protein [Bacillaceae]MBU9721326.1 hypothetical protein [Bacillus alkalicola]